MTRPSHVPHPVQDCGQCTAEPHRAPEDMTLSEAEALCEGMKGVVELESDAVGVNSVVDVTDLDQDAALEILFKGHKANGHYLLPESDPESDNHWPINEKPKPSLPIDDIIYRLITKVHNHSDVESGQEIWKSRMMCPYYAARKAIAFSASVGCHEKGIADAGNKAKIIVKKADTLISDLRDFLDVWHPGIEKDATPLDRRIDPIQTDKILKKMDEYREDVRKSVSALGGVANHFEKIRDQVISRGRPGNVWHLGFVRSLGFFWYFLTDSNPMRGEGASFRDFIDAAYLSLGGERGHDWDSQIRTAMKEVKTWPDWAGFEWVARSALPKLVRFDTAEDARRRLEKRRDYLIATSSPEQKDDMKAYGDLLVKFAEAMAKDSNSKFEDVIYIAEEIKMKENKIFNNKK